MNWVDFTALAVVVLPALSGLRHGLVAGLLKFGALGLFLGLALWKTPWLVQVARQYLPLGASVAPIAVIATALIVGWVVGALAALVWRKLSEGSVAWTDRALGALSGAIKGGFVAVGAMATLAAASPAARPSIEASWVSRHALAPLLEEGRARISQRLGLAAKEAQ